MHACRKLEGSLAAAQQKVEDAAARTQEESKKLAAAEKEVSALMVRLLHMHGCKH